ncbi:MAG: IclR family transcriptional regulator [Rhodospirillaceae bacterium]|nr:IclR family transcriptional regulator [Rhodospirillaceae bacterium]
MSALAYGLAILETVVGQQDSGATFTDIVARTGVPRASAHRLLKEMVTLGLLSFDPEMGRYRGSLKLASLGAAVTAHFDLRVHAHPHLKALHQSIGHPCHLSVRDGAEGVYVDKIESAGYGIKLFSEIGKRFPLHCTAMGKILLAHVPPEVLHSIVAGRMKPMTENTITSRTRLVAELAKVREQGYALDREEITRGLMCVAAPITGFGEAVIGAISTTFPTYIAAEGGLDALVQVVRACAARISGEADPSRLAADGDGDEPAAAWPATDAPTAP